MIENTEITRGKSKYCDKKIHENSANGSKATSKSEQAKRKGVKLNGCKTARLCARARLSFKYLPHNITPYPSEHNGAKNIVFFYGVHAWNDEKLSHAHSLPPPNLEHFVFRFNSVLIK